MPEIVLDSDHRYFVDGVRKPGVTEILDFNGLIPQFSKNDFAAEKGSAIHLAAKLLFQGCLDWSTVDERIVQYVRSLELFISTTGFKALSVEQAGYQRVFDYCGTWDVTGMFSNDSNDIVIDLKSGSPAKWHGVQLASYQQLCSAKRRASLYLQVDGSIAKFVEHKDPNHWKVFVACLEIYKKEKELDVYRQDVWDWLKSK